MEFIAPADKMGYHIPLKNPRGLKEDNQTIKIIRCFSILLIDINEDSIYTLILHLPLHDEWCSTLHEIYWIRQTIVDVPMINMKLNKSMLLEILKKDI